MAPLAVDSRLPDRAPGSSRLAELLRADQAESYPQALEKRRFEFPADHGPHPAYRNEWWYVTGNLDSDSGRRFGFELTIFRFALSAEPAAAGESTSAWRSNQVFIGHLALTDEANERFHVAQRFSRGSLGLAGATTQPFRVWIDDWTLTETSSNAEYRHGPPWRLRASDGDFALSLRLTPLKAPVLNGVDGLSQKAAEPGNASYYYSVTRLKTDGTIYADGEEHRVNGLSWLDREWGSNALSPEQSGWDWFALQLADGTDLMFYNLRRIDGSQDRHSAGTLTLADGSSIYLAHDDLSIEVLDTWDSPHGGRYPSAWRLGVPQQQMQLRIEPILPAQELITTVRYWEGAVDVTGTRGEEPIVGRGYVELTGYADRPD